MTTALFGRAPTASKALGSITNALIAAGALAPEKRRGYLARGRATLVAGTVIVTPGGAVAATDLFEVIEGGVVGGTENPRYVDTVVPGPAGTFTVTSANNADVIPFGWVQYDNTYVG